jgi:hypothetical protein
MSNRYWHSEARVSQAMGVPHEELKEFRRQNLSREKDWTMSGGWCVYSPAAVKKAALALLPSPDGPAIGDNTIAEILRKSAMHAGPSRQTADLREEAVPPDGDNPPATGLTAQNEANGTPPPHPSRLQRIVKGVTGLFDGSASEIPADPAEPVPDEAELEFQQATKNRNIVFATYNGQQCRVRVRDSKNFRQGMKMPCEHIDGNLWKLTRRCPRRVGRW